VHIHLQTTREIPNASMALCPNTTPPHPAPSFTPSYAAGRRGPTPGLHVESFSDYQSVRSGGSVGSWVGGGPSFPKVGIHLGEPAHQHRQLLRLPGLPYASRRARGSQLRNGSEGKRPVEHLEEVERAKVNGGNLKGWDRIGSGRGRWGLLARRRSRIPGSDHGNHLKMEDHTLQRSVSPASLLLGD
jgi:hypothetical protein